MNFPFFNPSFSMERLWLGSEESLADYLELRERINSADGKQMFFGFLDDSEPVAAEDIGDYLVTKSDDTATLSIKGSLVNGHQAWHPLFKGMITSYEAIKAATAKLAADDEIKNVVIDIGSSGGMAVGVQSAGKAIQKLGRKKNVIAHTDSMAASAAYWLASSASKVSASEMAEVGSIGVIAMMPDYTKALDMEGVKVNVLKAGKYKGAGSPYKEMSEDDRAYLQARVDKTNNFFLSHVSRRRGLKLSERENWADAKVFYAGEAKAVGLIDEVAELSDLLGGFSATNPSRGKKMDISEEKLAMIAAGASPESVLTSAELAAYNESLAIETTTETAEEIAAREAAEAQAAADAEAARLAAEEAGPGARGADKNTTAVAELAKENGKLEAKLEAANDQITKLTADLTASTDQVNALKGVAQAAVTNLQVALRQPKESKDSPAEIVAQYAGLKELMTKRMPVGRQSNSKVDTKELDVKPRAAGVPDPKRPR